MVQMSRSVFICEIREICGQKLFPALPGIIEDQRRFVFRAFGALGCGRTPRQAQLSPDPRLPSQAGRLRGAFCSMCVSSGQKVGQYSGAR